MPVWHIARNTISIRRSLRHWGPNSCLPFLLQNGEENISTTQGRWSRIVSRCCGMKRCRRSDDGSITWSLDGGVISIEVVGLADNRGTPHIRKDDYSGHSSQTSDD